MVRADESERLFRLSSMANLAEPVEPNEAALIIYTVARSAEILLTVRFYGQTHIRIRRGLRARLRRVARRDAARTRVLPL
jgi:hypothetical protein